VPARYLQIWIIPKDQYRDTDPYYEIIDRGPGFGPLEIDLHQDITVECGVINDVRRLNIDNGAYLYVITGQVNGDGWQLGEGDAVELNQESITAEFFNAHIILFRE